jgi:2',3'-cyclic-nucleotide 2'-phosphodiesterase (5'-nucleotidase family)
MQSTFFLFVLLSIAVSFSCSPARKSAVSKKDDGKLELIFLQVNDVYEIAPISGGKSGGMARVATIKKELLNQNPNTFLVMAGDFVSPSIYNSLTFNGKRIRGKQMIEAMNAAGMDLAVFGNHEFDISESELQERINESAFQWISSNSFHKKNDTTLPFQKQSGSSISFLPQTFILQLTDADGTTGKIGIIGITLPFNKADYVQYTDPINTAEQLYARIKDSCDAVIAITHLQIAEDIHLANRLPDLALILGGHEHDMRFEKTGNVLITKAHANAKSAYIIKLSIDKNKKSHNAEATLKMLDETVKIDSITNVVVTKWTEIANQNYASLGFDAKKVIVVSGDSLDGRETEVRSRPTNLTAIITSAMIQAVPDASVAIMNAGSIRLDDILYPPITQYDILRSLPFGGPIREADIKGSLLLQILETGQRNNGTGGYLHYHPVAFDSSVRKWKLNNDPIDTASIYKVAFSDFLVTGKEANLEFLNKDNPGMIKLYPSETNPQNSKSDIRLAIVRYLEKLNKK